MRKYVIDTNIPIVANGDEPNVTSACQLKAIELLQKAISYGKIYLDQGGEIQKEYRSHLQARGQPGVGDRFYLEVINSHPDRILRVELEKRADGEYADLPQPIIDSGFDPSDRVFAAVAKKVHAQVYNAVDTDWLEHRAVIEENGIPITFICGCVAPLWRE
jgi:hypothetical protein